MSNSFYSDRIVGLVLAGYICIVDDEINRIQVLSRVKNGRVHMVAYVGKKSKCAWASSGCDGVTEGTFLYALINVRRFYESVARENKPHDIVVNDIFVSSWGYEQTNIDYYQVKRLVGKTMIEVCQIEKMACAIGSMDGKCAPIKGQFKGESFKVKVNQWSDRPSFSRDYSSAYLERGDLSRYESSYH
jgi:hypothetical protein